MDVRSTFKADETAARGWFRTWGAAHPLGALFAGLAVGAAVVGLAWRLIG